MIKYLLIAYEMFRCCARLFTGISGVGQRLIVCPPICLVLAKIWLFIHQFVRFSQNLVFILPVCQILANTICFDQLISLLKVVYNTSEAFCNR